MKRDSAAGSSMSLGSGMAQVSMILSQGRVSSGCRANSSRNSSSARVAMWVEVRT
ncbi:hypothetical protein D3C78_1915330 [compost metagenome]